MTASQKRLKFYLDNHQEYFLEFVPNGLHSYYSVIQKGKGVVGSMQRRVVTKAIDDGIITIEEWNRGQQL